MKRGQTRAHAGTLRSGGGVISLVEWHLLLWNPEPQHVYYVQNRGRGYWLCQEVSIGEQSPAVSIWEEEEEAAVARILCPLTNHL